MSSIAESIQSVLEAAGRNPGFAHYALLGLGALVEYVFPPFPGDVVVLFGAFLVGSSGWSGPAVFVAILAGSLVGLSLDWAFGIWVRKRDAGWRASSRLWRRFGGSIDRFGPFYSRWGAVCILFNRFLPAIRAAFFVAAGMYRIPYWKVFLGGLASAAAWNALVFFVGFQLGNNWERMLGFFRTYSSVAWVAVGGAALVLVLRAILSRRRIRAN